MNDREKERVQRASDFVEWLDKRIAQRVEQELEQRFAQEREYWHGHVVDLIAAERERLVALIEEALRKVIDEFTADHKFNRLIAKVTESVDRVFDRLEAKLDQYAISGMCRPDDDSQPPPSRH